MAASNREAATPMDYWRMAAIGLLPIRLVQGFIFWGGGSRRFIYDPSKLDPTAPTWMGNKLQSAMPGPLLGTDRLLADLLHHPNLLYAAVIVFSLAELVAGAMLMAGLLTRVTALVTVIFAIVLMLLFGWQGATCIDEWTMSACNLAMGVTLMLAGGGDYALDNLILRRAPTAAHKPSIRWSSGSLPLPVTVVAGRRLGLASAALTAVFVLATYSYFRGSVVGPYHAGPVSPAVHHFTLTNAAVHPDGSVHFRLYLDGGTPAVPAHIVSASLIGPAGEAMKSWNIEAFGRLPPAAIVNEFAYNRIKVAAFGLAAGMGARADIVLLGDGPGAASGARSIEVTTIDDRRFSAELKPSAGGK